ncbi:MAG: hypothetical protein WC878_03185 [Candidatus Paceibacterota bacterium]|jgi:hypothetical protein
MTQTTLQYSPLPSSNADLSPVISGVADFVQNPPSFWHQFLASHFFLMFQFFLFFISSLLFFGIVMLVVKTGEIRKKQKKETIARGVRFEEVKSKRWQMVEKYMESENPAEWKLAIIEADAMLEAMVKKMGYSGATLGEMLKKAEISDFNTLDDAWKAHKVRNFIAHQGSSFLLSKHQAREVVRLYENVFREFEMI